MVIFILSIFIVFSGCLEEKNITQSNESVDQGSVDKTPENLSSTILSSKEENISKIPEIEVTSFSSIHMHDNNEKVYDYLFSWDNVPGSENQRLISYLQEEKKIEGKYDLEETKSDLQISWGNHAQIIKSNNNKIIRVYFTSSNSTELIDNNGNILRTPDVELKVEEVDGKCSVLMTPQTLQDIELEGKEVNGKLCIYKVKEKPGYNITERYYVAYGLLIKNNSPINFDFRLNELHVRDGDHIFNVTIEPLSNTTENNYRFWGVEVLSDLEKETKLENITLSSGQTINGSVVFQVNSLYNESFILMYNETPITSVSFEKSIDAMRTAERHNYSVIFGKPPYSFLPDSDSFESNLEEYHCVLSNWLNRSIFELFDKVDSESFYKKASGDVTKLSIEDINTELVYALKVIPERNITLKFEKNIFYPEPYPRNQLIVVDVTGEELINTFQLDEIAILKNQTYELHPVNNMDILQMNFSNVTIVKISFMSNYWGTITPLNQYVILDKKLNIVAASDDRACFVF